jgi:two-component system, cell cycle sensor histidine kinase and response regulator CckA
MSEPNRLASRLMPESYPERLLPDWVSATEGGSRSDGSVTDPAARTVLLVDDEDSVRKVARRVLERSGYNVFAAATAVEALALFEEHRDRIDLLLTDVIMPVMNGRELADALLLERPELPVLFMSGHSYDALDNRPLGTLPFTLLHKPFGPQDLNRAVRDRLTRDSEG